MGASQDRQDPMGGQAGRCTMSPPGTPGVNVPVQESYTSEMRFSGAGGFSTLENYAKVGQMLMDDGLNLKGERVLPSATISDILTPPRINLL